MAQCPACNTTVKPFMVTPDMRKHQCQCGEFFTTKEIIVSRGRRKDTAPAKVVPHVPPRYDRGAPVDARSIANAIARMRVQDKKEST